MRFKQQLVFLLLAFLMIGCSNLQNKSTVSTEKQENEKQEPDVITEEQQQDINPEEEDLDIEEYKARDAEEMVQLRPGKYGEQNYDEEKVKEAIKEFPKGLSADEYVTRLLALTADDYRSFYNFFTEFDTSYDDPDAGPGKIDMAVPLEKNINVAILLDSSGSMNGKVDGKTKMELAKSAIQTFVSELPSNVNVSLLVYGHKGTGNDKDKTLSCGSTEVIYQLSPYNKEQFSTALNTFSPSGWTPLASSIAAAHNDLQTKTEEDTENIVYIVSDGIETCDGNPVEEAKKLNESNVRAIVNIIGFDVDNAGQDALKKVAEAGKGKYSTVTSQEALEKFFKGEKHRLINEWYEWQAKHVDSYYDSQNERVDKIYEVEKEMLDKANNEMNRLLPFSNLIHEATGINSSDIRIIIRDRAYNIRKYARDMGYYHRKELRDKGFESRENVRDKGYEEREKLRRNETP
ncbi:vWA domain-containing protein [Metabacillus fastidiosus]|uniref:vWA domain-containing protein n=1 Tax=Metabacillus fastidiosus TaxID=1458 RepID=UPI003D2AC2E9